MGQKQPSQPQKQKQTRKENLGLCFYKEQTNKIKNPINLYYYDPHESD